MEDFQPMSHLKLEPLQKEIGQDDLLLNIFIKQKMLCLNYKWLEGKSQEEATKVFAQAIASEAQELMNQTNWKSWKQGKKEFNRTETIYELIDILHFVVNNLIELNVGPYECMQHYIAKNKENMRRIKNGY